MQRQNLEYEKITVNINVKYTIINIYSDAKIYKPMRNRSSKDDGITSSCTQAV